MGFIPKPVSDVETTVTIYSAESKIRSPGALLRTMWQDLLDSRELAWRLFIRDISARYRQSVLGIFWSFLPPIVTGFVFILLQSSKVVNLGEVDIPYPVYALVGMILWQVFTESLNAPLKSVSSAKVLLTKINFPYEALILSAFLDVLINYLIKLIVLLVIIIIFKVQLTLWFFVSPIFVFMLIILGISIGLLITPLGMLYTDVSSSLPLITQVWFFLTPVVYPPLTSFPFSIITRINPVTPLLISARDLMTKGTMPEPLSIFFVCGFAVVTLFISWIIYRISVPILVERISA
jgi:lipopolysaccharide transport system permease protein